MPSLIFKSLLVLLLSLLVAPGQAAPALQTLLVFGDSLSAGYGIRQEQSWPALLQARLAAGHYPYKVANASISGETTRGGLSRLPQALAQFQPVIVIIELGANDGLRGLPIAQMRANLAEMIRISEKKGAQVLLVGMQLPPNYGSKYTQSFEMAYADLARVHHVRLLPFLFEGFAEWRDAFQDDGLHPTAATQPLLLENVWRTLSPLLKRS